MLSKLAAWLSQDIGEQTFRSRQTRCYSSDTGGAVAITSQKRTTKKNPPFKKMHAYGLPIQDFSVLIHFLTPLERFRVSSGLGNKSSFEFFLKGGWMVHKSRDWINQERACGHLNHQARSKYSGRRVGKERQRNTKPHFSATGDCRLPC